MNTFLTEKGGITSTSANYLCNLAKEQIKSLETKLKNISFLNKEVSIISSQESKLLRKGISTLDDAQEIIEEIGKLKAFNAWMREAIKAKENLEVMSFPDWREANNYELESPTLDESVTTDDILDEMSIKERQYYLFVEAMAATYGQYIHPDGSISKAREDFLFHQEVPTEISGSGRDMLVYEYTPSIKAQDLNGNFNKLQNKYREYEKTLNSLKFQIKEKIRKRNGDSNKKYAMELEHYNIRYKELSAQYNQYRIEEEKKNAAMQIAIPDNLRGTYELLNSLGKEK